MRIDQQEAGEAVVKHVSSLHDILIGVSVPQANRNTNNSKKKKNQPKIPQEVIVALQTFLAEYDLSLCTICVKMTCCFVYS